ncbi:hypothetical protein D7Z54_23210 [Salibacterium salarium]|uniref:Uncharacterized protein n=1 Tax=Salibacterium salarium TaxID=284579 RepID=A0A3R9P5S0_9BACI|nr:hypothetical protein [Salibacterium salarium]RSL30889.1 hypothetical protein D7Z54_23210 [Salibacterium salarium]
MNYECRVEKDYIVYNILLMNLSLCKKTVHPKKVTRIKFKRFGWWKKGAIVEVKKEVNIRLIDFKSDRLFEELNMFGEGNGISVIKTKDYLFLEN